MVEASSPAAEAVRAWKPDAGALCLSRQQTGAAVNPVERDAPPVTVGRADPGDADGIARVHVAVWRTAYPGMLPDHTLAALSRPRLAVHYEWAIRRGAGVLVARSGALVVGFATLSRQPPGAPGEGEVETLYVLDDWRERGIGRALMQAAARALRDLGCRSLFLWVLAENPSRWFYERLGGRPALRSTTRVGGVSVPRVAIVWDPIERLAGPAGD